MRKQSKNEHMGWRMLIRMKRYCTHGYLDIRNNYGLGGCLRGNTTLVPCVPQFWYLTSIC